MKGVLMARARLLWLLLRAQQDLDTAVAFHFSACNHLFTMFTTIANNNNDDSFKFRVALEEGFPSIFMADEPSVTPSFMMGGEPSMSVSGMWSDSGNHEPLSEPILQWW